MANKHIHAELAPNEYQALLRASRKAGLSTPEAIREATLAWVRDNFADSEGLVSILSMASKSSDADPLDEETSVRRGPAFERAPSRPR